MRRPSFRFETVARASVIFLVLIFVAAAMLMASKNPSQPATVARAGNNPSTNAYDAPGAEARSTASLPVTITGCLEQRDDAYRLKDTAGDDVPKARSWKSGFLRKAPSAIAVIDASNRVKLSTHIGERISVTGVLIDREMKVRSLRKVAAACS
jgi:hypothetical protein